MGSNATDGNEVSKYLSKDGQNIDAVHSASVKIDSSHLNHCTCIKIRDGTISRS